MDFKRTIAGALALGLLSMSMAQAGAAEFEDRLWTATEIKGAPVLGARPPTATFATNGTVSGFSGCNQYTGGYTFNAGDGALSFTPIASTRMACPGPQGDIERAYFSALGAVSSAAIGADGLLLVLSDDAGEPVVSFVPGPK